MIATESGPAKLPAGYLIEGKGGAAHLESILPVVLAGGAGTRLWPLSRGCYPKHFLSLTSDRSMLQETLLRVARLDAMPPYIVCNEEHRFLVAEHCREIAQDCGAILLENVACGTAPAVGAGGVPRAATRRGSCAADRAFGSPH